MNEVHDHFNYDDHDSEEDDAQVTLASASLAASASAAKQRCITAGTEQSFTWILQPILQVLTKDSVTVTVNAVMYYRVADPISAVNNVDDYEESARLLAATTLRNVLGNNTLGEILSERDTIAANIKVNN